METTKQERAAELKFAGEQLQKFDFMVTAVEMVYEQLFASNKALITFEYDGNHSTESMVKVFVTMLNGMGIWNFVEFHDDRAIVAVSTTKLPE